MKQLKLFSVLLLLLFSAGAKAQFAWYGSEGVAQIETNLAEGNDVDQGVWWVATDWADGGKSKVVWDDGTENSSPDDNHVKTYGGLSGTAVLDIGSLTYGPTIYVGFNVAGVKEGYQKILADASAWGGIAISYSCDVAASLELSFGESVDASLGYALHTGNLPAAPDGNFVRIPWSSFKQPAWGKKSLDIEEAVKQLAAVKLKIQGSQYASDAVSCHFKISAIGSYDMPETAPLSTQCKLKITATGDGTAKFGSTTIRNTTNSLTVDKGTSPKITFTPDAGNKIKSVKVGTTDVTSSVKDNSYTVTNIQSNTTVAVEFESNMCDLTISASGNGSATIGSTTVSNTTKNVSVEKGTNPKITFNPDEGYKIKSVKVGGTDVTSSVKSNSYTIKNIQGNTTVTVEFMALSTYELKISATGNGSALFNDTPVRNSSKSFTVVEGTNAKITFNPDYGYRVESVKLGSLDVTASVTANSYTINDFHGNAVIEVVFGEIPPEPCATPTITYADGKLSFSCDTEDAQFVYEITNADVRTGTANYEVKLGGSEKVSVFKVRVYAKKDGFADSEVVTKEIKLSFLAGDVNSDGKRDVKDVVTLVNMIAAE